MKRKRIRAIPEPTWRSKCGTVQLYHADCLKILPTFPDKYVDAVVTDPPYGIAHVWRGGFSLKHGWGKAGIDSKTRNKWDAEVPQRAINIIVSMRVLSVIWGGNHFQLPASRGWLVWNKPERNFTLAEAELAWTNKDMVVRVFDCLRSDRGREHPTQKPLRLMKWVLDRIQASGTVLDPFMGSGTTGVACVKTGRKFIGIEIDEKYYEIAKRRISNALKERRLFTR